MVSNNSQVQLPTIRLNFHPKINAYASPITIDSRAFVQLQALASHCLSVMITDGNTKFTTSPRRRSIKPHHLNPVHRRYVVSKKQFLRREAWSFSMLPRFPVAGKSDCGYTELTLACLNKFS
ncbi:hypothetical protein OIU76_024601 [Salix suchowensis]|uniref:Uncharacterized protein n=1 Tax=Salix suchowensis TaxID=1278906 RepID=A0ABQ9B0W6_9ROSI|nr:hypothetical protein OIU76_024601 [Salix suchowensis]KAJ6366875.1 hypothetical protein OIU77_003285 [Salix suchowensis]